MLAKNLDREMTVTPCRDKNDKIVLSFVIPLSPVTKYFAFPRIAVSMMISSSGSRHNFVPGFIVTRFARVVMDETKSLISCLSIRYLNKNFGRLKTSPKRCIKYDADLPFHQRTIYASFLVTISLQDCAWSVAYS